jgi:hypothetical protein
MFGGNFWLDLLTITDLINIRISYLIYILITVFLGLSINGAEINLIKESFL